jgi:hypothetical protein
MWPMSELTEWPSKDPSDVLRETVPASPSEVLIEHLGVTRRTTAEVQDMYSRPIPALVVMVGPKDSLPKHQEPAPDLDAA